MSSENVLFYKQRKILKCGCARLPDHITEQRRYEAQRDLRPLTRPAELPPSPYKVAVHFSDGMVHCYCQQTESSPAPAPAPGYREEEEESPHPCSPRHRSAAHPALSLLLLS